MLCPACSPVCSISNLLPYFLTLRVNSIDSVHETLCRLVYKENGIDKHFEIKEINRETIKKSKA